MFNSVAKCFSLPWLIEDNEHTFPFNSIQCSSNYTMVHTLLWNYRWWYVLSLMMSCFSDSNSWFSILSSMIKNIFKIQISRIKLEVKWKKLYRRNTKESPTTNFFAFTNSFQPDVKRCLCGVPSWLFVRK